MRELNVLAAHSSAASRVQYLFQDHRDSVYVGFLHRREKRQRKLFLVKHLSFWELPFFETKSLPIVRVEVNRDEVHLYADSVSCHSVVHFPSTHPRVSDPDGKQMPRGTNIVFLAGQLETVQASKFLKVAVRQLPSARPGSGSLPTTGPNRSAATRPHICTTRSVFPLR